jgi:zinc/manganese transport system substrate-binding protein
MAALNLDDGTPLAGWPRVALPRLGRLWTLNDVSRAFTITFWLILASLTTAARAEGRSQIKVLTTFLPVYCFAANVAGSLAEVENLLPPGADPHDFQFTAREMKKLGTADVLVMNGLHLESWMDRIIHSPDGPKRIVEAASGLTADELIIAPAYLYLLADGKTVNEETRFPNPHIWLDPVLAAHAVSNILSALQDADPANAGGYERNARQYLARLQVLDADLRRGLQPMRGQPIVTFHDAFPYFARRYGLRILGVIEQTEDVEPSIRYLGALGRLIQREKTRVIFGERQSSPRLPERIALDYGAKVVELDTLETGLFKPEAYEEGMRKNLRALEGINR